MTAGRRMALLLAGTAALTAATILSAAFAPPGPVLPLASAAYVACVLWAVLARSRHDAAAWRVRLGPIALALALLASLVDRHLVVASRGVAPDDIAAVATSIGLLVAAVRAPRLTGHPVALGAALAAYALIGVALVAGAPYQTDAVANVHRAAELLLSGADPYRSVDTYESLDRFGLDRTLATHLEDGTPLRTFNYPALAVLLPAPFVAMGLADVRALYLAEVLVAGLAASTAVALAWRPLVLAAMIGNVVIARQHVLAGVDPTWAILLGAALLALERARHRLATRALWLSALLLGLACASRQPAWFAVPFAIAAVAQYRGTSDALRYAALAAAAFVLPALPFLAVAPMAHITGVLAPILLPLEPYGVGLARLGADGVLPLLGRGTYAVLALAALVAAVALSLRRRPAAAGLAALALIPLYLAWRALQSYFTFVGPFAALAVAQERDDMLVTTVRDPVRSRQTWR